MYLKNIKMNNGNEQHPKIDTSKVTIPLAMENLCKS